VRHFFGHSAGDIIQIACRGKVEKLAPQTARCHRREAAVAIISIAQQASPNCSGQIEFLAAPIVKLLH